MDAVAIVYPINAYVDVDRKMPHKSACLAYSLGQFWENRGILKPGQALERYKLINRLIDQYRIEGRKVFWLLFSQEKNREVCDEQDISPVYEINPQDTKLPVGVTYLELSNAKYPNEDEVIRKMGKLRKVTFGGFHKCDCVSRFANAARRAGMESNIDNLLTEEFFWKTFFTFEEDFCARAIETGHLDAKMHEDDPREEKLAWMDHRLDAYL